MHVFTKQWNVTYISRGMCLYLLKQMSLYMFAHNCYGKRDTIIALFIFVVLFM